MTSLLLSHIYYETTKEEQALFLLQSFYNICSLIGTTTTWSLN